mmetsp:Transcript_25326/g.25067  ORF Transcript_25326/g.25067 Transcript_25326/m.25067 type:complete len:92 (-) Transcript_25326:484-759(-)
MLLCYRQLLHIKTTMTGSWENKRIRKEWMLKRWKQEKAIMMGICKESKKRSLKTMNKLMVQISESVRNKVIDFYLDFALNKFNYKYYTWRK